MNRLIHIRIIIFLVLLMASVCWAGEPYKAEVIGISDGDTIKVLQNGKQVRIRLYGIDTPEKRQAFGKRTGHKRILDGHKYAPVLSGRRRCLDGLSRN